MWLALIISTSMAGGWPDLSKVRWQESGDGRSDYALVIGVEDYAFIDDVAGAIKSARDWQRWLIQGRGLPTDQVKLLVNASATKERIEEEARALGSLAGPSSTVWVVYVGHGAPAKGGKDGLLVGVDAQQTALSLEARGVRRTDLERWVSGEQKATVMVLDSCFSGKDTSGAELVSNMQTALATSLAPTAGITLLTAGHSDEYAGTLPGLGRPAFSYLMLGALSGWGDKDDDGEVTAGEAVAYSRGALGVLLTDRTQTPQVSKLGADVVLGRGRAKGPDLFELQGESGGEVYGSGGFGGTPFNVRDKLKERACEDAARELTSTWVAGQLDSASSSLKKEAESAWRSLAVEARACLELPRSERGECISAVSGWLSKAERAKVRVGAGVHQVKASCGVRELGYEGVESAVSVGGVAGARSLLAKLKKGDRRKEVNLDGHKYGAAGYVGSGLLAAAGASSLVVGMLQRSSLKDAAVAGTIDTQAAEQQAIFINGLVVAGYFGLGASAALGVGMGVSSKSSASKVMVGWSMRW